MFESMVDAEEEAAAREQLAEEHAEAVEDAVGGPVEEPPVSNIAPYEELEQEYSENLSYTKGFLGSFGQGFGVTGGLGTGGYSLITHSTDLMAFNEKAAAAAAVVSGALFYGGLMLKSDDDMDTYTRRHIRDKMDEYRFLERDDQDAVISLLDESDAVWQGSYGDELDGVHSDEASDLYQQVMEEFDQQADSMYQEFVSGSATPQDTFGILTYIDGEPAHVWIGTHDDIRQYTQGNDTLGTRIRDDQDAYRTARTAHEPAEAQLDTV